MKYFCLCMSPALDALTTLPAAPRGAGEIFKDVPSVENAGGKGINVARWLRLRGAEDVACGGLLGSDNATPFEGELRRYGIRDRFLRVPGSTRRNVTVAWPGGAFKINRTAFPDVTPPRPEDLLPAAGEAETVILSGSLPACCDPSYYADCIRLLKDRGCRTVLDASGKALAHGVEAGPDLVKPNADECEALVGFVPKTLDDFRRATERLLRKVPHVIISDGASGAWFDGIFEPAPQVEVVDTTAAGDTLLAEWCLTHDPKRAVRAGSAACTMPGSQPPPVP